MTAMVRASESRVRILSSERNVCSMVDLTKRVQKSLVGNGDKGNEKYRSGVA